MSHDERSEIFMNFNKSTNSFLICTDVASRGLDFMNIDWVIHYDINPDVKEYINRMGRTARLDKGGNSLMFVMNNENEIIDDFNKKINNNNNCINEILCSEILLKFLDNFNKNLKNKIEIKSLNFEDEIDENEKFRKEFFYVIAPIKKMIKDFIFENKENLILARKGFKSWVRAYGNNNKFYRNIFNVKKLNLTRISRSFGLYKESMKIKVNGNEMNVDYEFEKKNVKMDKKIFNKKIQKKIMFSEFEN
jgi:ATP-dependent RNA helicase DDX31/DBP7